MKRVFLTLYRLTTQKGEFEVVEGKKKRAHVKERRGEERRKGRSNKEEERRRAKQGKGKRKTSRERIGLRYLATPCKGQCKKDYNYHGVEYLPSGSA